MKNLSITTLAFFLCQMNPALASPPNPKGFKVPAECNNLALMQGQLLLTQFHNNTMGGGVYNPPSLELKSNNGLNIGAVQYLGGDSEDQSGDNVGKYPCDTDKTLCLSPADAGGDNDWARVTVMDSETPAQAVATVVVSMGGRGGCTINSSTIIGNM